MHAIRRSGREQSTGEDCDRRTAGPPDRRTAGSGSAVEVDVGYKPGRSEDPGMPFISSHFTMTSEGRLAAGISARQGAADHRALR